MQEILKQQFFDNSVEAYLTVIIIIFSALIFKRFISKYIAGILFKIFKAGKNFRKAAFLNLEKYACNIF